MNDAPVVKEDITTILTSQCFLKLNGEKKVDDGK